MPIRSSRPSASESCLLAPDFGAVGLGKQGLAMVLGVSVEVEAAVEVRLVVGSE